MAKYQGKRSAGGDRQASHRQRKPQKGRGPLIALVVILIALLGAGGWMLLSPGGQRQENPQPEEHATAQEDTEPAQPEEEPQQPGLTFPYALEDGGLTVTSLFSSDIINPDGGNEMGESLASLELTNTSEQYLIRAEIAVTLTDGTAYSFVICDLPAGGQVMAFSPENAVYDGETGCESITASAQFAGEDPLMADQVSCVAEGTTVTLTNLTGEDLGPLTVTCHDSLDGAAFGGISYAYPVESIPAGESVTVEALDCILGEATVVRITPEG